MDKYQETLLFNLQLILLYYSDQERYQRRLTLLRNEQLAPILVKTQSELELFR
jgi:hypothetical protein